MQNDKNEIIETPSQSIDITNSKSGVISLNHLHKQQTEVVNCGCYKLGKKQNQTNIKVLSPMSSQNIDIEQSNKFEIEDEGSVGNEITMI